VTDDVGLIELGRTAHRVETGDVQLTDPRLRAVWNQLMRRDRKTGRFLTPTTFDVGYGTAEDRQRFAIGMLLTAACEAPRPVMRRCDLDVLRDKMRGQAAMLRSAVDELQRLGLRPLHNIAEWPQADSMIVAAAELDDAADDLEWKVLVVDADHGMQFERAAAVWLAGVCQMLFGKPLYRTVARLVEVLTEHKIDRYRIRDWWTAAAKNKKRPRP
jgi:hypothetical protein